MAQPTVSTSRSAAHDRLAYFEVRGLFSAFTYRIPLNLNQRVTAIIAPNGSGKTICLRLINSLFTQQWSFFSDLDFESVHYRFESGFRVTISHEPRSEEGEEAATSLGIVFKVEHPTGEAFDWRPGPTDPKIIRTLPLERYINYLTRRSLNQYVHDYTGASYTYLEAVEAFSSALPQGFRHAIYGEMPPVLGRLVGNIDCHLIETQRLLILRDEVDDAPYRSSRTQRSSLAIARKAQLLKTIIAKDLTAYAALSQSLDRSFPKRVINLQSILDPENLKARLAMQDEKRASLMLAGILDSEIDDPVTLPEGNLPDAISRVLSVFAQDTEQKLDVLTKLQTRIELFSELIRERFSSKDVVVSKESGFEITFRNQRIPLDALSSGEQHQLVLFFELLFELRENALILIDEPELSLHVAWQKKFILDLQRIIALNQFDVILATHSPQLISRWNDLVVELGKVDEE
ncbi:AAA family ATPase [Bradyrhizobium sp. BRP23]|uniref:AAA family ATPase n=1 Tax=Bradyrhizobium sp. BRP23 TaxID=2793820 RepID=UPI001CD5BECC|nr:AAA family ATPase [Bradyrhizobium sp. BRP23]MCA1381460.1 AAA family ATPase [Bradyrhizobium sp. BRP05]MCA1422284.1 AAA family ATPase [Bradyrhizobium sp. BRP23]